MWALASRRSLLAVLVCALLLVAAPISRAEDDVYDDGDYDDYPDEGQASDEEVSEKDVVVLTSKNFDAVISKAKYALVEFYAPWCGHCKSLKPHYAKAATVLKEYDPSIVIAKVDATEEEDLASKFEVKGFPTLKWFVDGEATEYGGGRDEKTIVSWIKKKTGPPAATVTTKDEFEKISKDASVVVVGYFSEFKGPAFDAFVTLASKTDMEFVQTTVAEVAGLVSLSAPGVAIKKSYSFEEPSIETSAGELNNLDDLKAFVQAKKLPLYIPFSQDNADIIFESGLDTQIMFIADTDTLDSEAFDVFKTVAKEFAGKLMFVTTNVDVKEASAVIEFFGVSDADAKPVIFGFSTANNAGTKYKMPGEYGLESLQHFAQSLVDKTAKPDYKSEDIPENNKDGDVTIVVGKTFDEIVKDDSKDVLIEVYAPWCGHCKSLEPIYKKLAKRFKKIDSVVIAKLDGTANEHPELNVEGFPTLIFYPAGGKPAVPLDGERTLASMTKFIKQHATIPYELPKKKAGDESDDDEVKDEL